MNKTDKTLQVNDIIDDLFDISYRAGAAIMQYYQSPRSLETSLKTDQSPLTAADLAAHKIICDGLNQLTPQLPVLSEESEPCDFAKRQTWTRYWLVDPLDGTKEFIKHRKHFTVNIALIERHRATFGIVYAPALNRWYWASDTLGAFKGLGQNQPLRLNHSITPSQLRIVASRNHQHPQLQQLLTMLPSYKLINMGNSLKFCHIAQGLADLYPRLGPTSEWDTAAAHCILSNAGGDILTLDGQSLRYNSKDSLLNPAFIAIANPNSPWLKDLMQTMSSSLTA